jgi:Predicted glycosyltransferases
MNENKNKLLISVIVPTFNRKDFLTQAIHSILIQSYSNLEIIIVDNYSNYNFIELIKEFNDKRIKAYQIPKIDHKGVIAHNRNYAVNKASGDFIAFCDDDDLWAKDKLERQINLLAKTNSDFCFTGFDIIKSDNIIIKQIRLKFWQKSLSLSSFTFSLGYVCNSSVMIRRSLLEKIGILNEDPKLLAVEDYEYIYRIISQFKPVYIAESLVQYRIHDSRSSKVLIWDWFKKQLYLNTIILKNNKGNRITIALKYLKITLKFILLSLKVQKI